MELDNAINEWSWQEVYKCHLYCEQDMTMVYEQSKSGKRVHGCFMTV